MEGNNLKGSFNTQNNLTADKCQHELLVKPKLLVRPITLSIANKFVLENHRHHKPVIGHKFSIGCYESERLIGVAIVGRPLSRKLDNGLTAEVTRLCTDGTKMVASKLYSACWRIAKEMGYDKIITYILESEPGISLKASGWMLEEEHCGGLAWNSSGKIERTDISTNLFETIKKYPNEYKKRYAKKFSV